MGEDHESEVSPSLKSTHTQTHTHTPIGTYKLELPSQKPKREKSTVKKRHSSDWKKSTSLERDNEKFCSSQPPIDGMAGSVNTHRFQDSSSGRRAPCSGFDLRFEDELGRECGCWLCTEDRRLRRRPTIHPLYPQKCSRRGTENVDVEKA